MTQFTTASLTIAASSAITNNLLLINLPIHAPSVNPKDVFSVGAYDLQKRFSGAELLGVRCSYIVGLRGAWALGIALFGIAFLAAFLPKWPGKIVPHSDTTANQEGAETSASGKMAVTPVM